MTEQYIQLLKTNPETIFWGQAFAVIVIAMIIIVEFVVMLILCSRLKKQMRKIDRTIDKANQYLNVIMRNNDEDEDMSLEKAGYSTPSGMEKPHKYQYGEDTNHIISAVLDEVFQ